MHKRKASSVLVGLLLATAAITAISPAPPLFAGANQPVTELQQTEIQMLQMINNDRMAPSNAGETKGRAKPLEWDSRLAAVAREHSEEMAQEGFFSHQSLDGSLPSTRVSKAGIHWRACGENIAKFPGASQAESAFMDEPKFQHNHRGNILNPEYTHVGVGIARGPDGMLYVTQEFASLF